MQTYGNANLLAPNGGQTLTFDGTSKVTAALDSKTIAVELLATTDCWIKIGEQGATPTAENPANATRSESVFLRAGIVYTFPVPLGIGGAIKIAAIQDTATGFLAVTERRE
jgi:hypothetical protein